MFFLAIILCLQGFYTNSKCNLYQVQSMLCLFRLIMFRGFSVEIQQSEPKLKLNLSDVMTLRIDLVIYQCLEKWGIKESYVTLLSKRKIYWKIKKQELV